MKLTKSFTLTRCQSVQSEQGYNTNIGFMDNVPFYQNEYEFLLERHPDDYQKIKEWVERELMPYMTKKMINGGPTSYSLKYEAEKDLHFYVCNSDIKFALLEKNVPFKSYNFSPNVSYPLSERFYKDRRRRRAIA